MVKVIFKNITCPYGLLLIAILVSVIGRVVFKKKYLDCYEIIKRHLECFKTSDNRYSKVSLFLYFGVPAVVSIALVRIRNIDDDVINIITVIISILTSMLFTMLTLVLDMRKRIISDKDYNANKAAISAKLLKETYYSIMYEILNSIIILIRVCLKSGRQKITDTKSCKRKDDTVDIRRFIFSVLLYGSGLYSIFHLP